MYEMQAVPTTALGAMCTKPVIAIGMLVQGQTVIVAGGDMVEMWRTFDGWRDNQSSEAGSK